MRSLVGPWTCTVLLVSLLGMAACEGPSGPAGEDGADGTGCTATTNQDGTITITCGENSVTLTNGQNGAAGEDGRPCTATAGEGTVTITCPGADPVVVSDGTDGTNGTNGTDGQSCTATTGTGQITITCPGADPVVIKDGTDAVPCTVTRDDVAGTATITCPGVDPVVVADGMDGVDGTDCTVVDNGNKSKTITCGDTSVTVFDGATGPSAADVVNLAAEIVPVLNLTVNSITITGKPVVQFTVKDNANRGAVGIKAGSSGGNIRFTLAKLVPATATETGEWVDYVIGSTGTPSSDRTGTLVDHRDGTYTYTFATDVTNVTTPVAIAWEPTLTTRLAIQVSGSVNGNALPYVNALYDFVPAGGTITDKREIASTAACNECHGKLRLHGSRQEVGYCVMCHNPGLGDEADMAHMTHAIHAAHKRAADGATAYELGGHEYGEVTYPQGLNNCKKCHDGALAATPQGDNWKTFPSANACGACHASAAAATHFADVAGTACKTCHTAAKIASVHASENNTPNATGVIVGAYNFVYEIKEVTVDGTGHPIITFKILKDGVPLDVINSPADLVFGPSFLLAYALPQGGIDEPADYNNLGRTAAQPLSVSLANIKDGTKGTLSALDADGYHVATLTGTNAFPVGATMRAIALQGYFSQKDFPAAGSNLGRHTVAVLKEVAGDTVRREVVDSDKCAACHEWFEGHGGNRVRTVAVCVTCHVPNLSSSGRGADVANMSQADKDAATAAGYDVANALSFPEVSQNMKELIHSIHGAAARGEDHYQFVRDRGTSGVFFYDFAEVTYPNNTGCLACHKPGTYSPETIPATALQTTVRTTAGMDLSPADVVNIRKTVPNTTDWVQSPTVGACGSCHVSATAVAHFEQNGGYINITRDASSVEGLETCALCHGAGRAADVSGHNM